MANTSATGGPLEPQDAPGFVEDIELDKLFQATVAAITGLAGEFVRPRWQTVTPKQPEANVNWCAIGVMSDEADAGPVLIHKSTIDGSMDSIRHEDLRVLASFYGPNAKGLAKRLRDGLGIPQNLEALGEVDIAFVRSSTIIPAPALVNQQWIRRHDLPLVFRRKVLRNYAVRNLAAADVHLFDDTHVDETITVSPPTP